MIFSLLLICRETDNSSDCFSHGSLDLFSPQFLVPKVCFIWLVSFSAWVSVCETAQLKHVHELKQSGKESSSPLSAAARSYTMGTPPPQPPPPSPPPKESFARRYKFLWPLLLTVNVAVGGPFSVWSAYTLTYLNAVTHDCSSVVAFLVFPLEVFQRWYMLSQ